MDDSEYLVDGQYGIADLVDLDEFREVCERFSASLGFTVALLDNPGLTILIATGWQEICTRFHRACPEAAAVCRESDRQLMEVTVTPGKLVIRECGNGFMDCAFPIIVKGKHIASLFAGQLLLEPPDRERFRLQARRFGFDEAAYMRALDKVPVISHAHLQTGMELLGKIAGLLSRIGYSALLVREESERLKEEISMRSRMEQALRESEGRLNEAQRIAKIGSWEHDIITGELKWSDEIYRILEVRRGEVDASARVFVEFTHPDDRELVDSAYSRSIRECKPFENTHRLLLPDGRVKYVSMRGEIFCDQQGNPVRAAGTIQDITERRATEDERDSLRERLQRAEKMEALGTLAGGVAHDLNNVLGIVVGYAEMLMCNMDESDPMAADVRNIMHGGERAAAIVHDLLTLARRGVQSSKVVNLNTVVTDFKKTPEFGKLLQSCPDIDVEMSLQEDLLNIVGSQVHLAKSLMNLVSNAVEAMPGGGLLRIETLNQYLDRPVRGYDDIRQGDYVVLRVSDTGEGIAAGDIEHIFEPFYTKKVMGRSGTGLGLAVVWGAVKDHNGYIDVRSLEGQGTVFTLYFPATRKDTVLEQDPLMSEYMGYGEAILVVDDVEEQRDLAVRMLSRLNYRVNSAASGEAAVEYLRSGRVDLVILDMIMDEGMDGLDTFKKIREMHPGQKAIIVSGFSESERVKEAQALGAGAYVRKPYILKRLGLAVRKELDS
jgi:PAS domain S-box-containing protein